MTIRSLVRQGGLMRCCIATIAGLAEQDDREDRIVQCELCHEYLMFKGGAWQWKSYSEVIYGSSNPA